MQAVTKPQSHMRPTMRDLGIIDKDLPLHLTDTNQSHLPQVPLLQGALASLKEKGMLQEAYLRGSFSTGHADRLSDIDFFAVVKPENLPAAHEHFQNYLRERGNIIIGCHDKFVKNYGGIGFMYLFADRENQTMYQFDIYFAMEGIPPREMLANALRIYSRNKEYSWIEDQVALTAPIDKMPEDTVNFLDHHTNHQAEKGVISCFNDLVVGLFIMDKHLKRGQLARAFNDNYQNTNAVVEMLRHGVSPDNKQTSFYSFDSIAEDVNAGGDILSKVFAKAIAEGFDKPASAEKIHDMFNIGVQMLEAYAPQHHAQQFSTIATMGEIFKPR